MNMQEMMKMWDMSKVSEMWDAEKWNVENMKELSEKNIAKCKEANEVLLAGMNKYAKRQAELTKECVESNIASAKEVASAKTVEEFVAKQKNAVEAWVEKNTKVVQELSDIAKESQAKASELIKDMAN